MELLSLVFFLVFQFIFFITFVPTTFAQFHEFHTTLCGNLTYTLNSTYHNNLKAVLNTISSNTRITNGYYNFTAGQSPDKVEAMVLCRADVPVNACRFCARDSVAALQEICPNQKQAFGVTENCIVFHSQNSTLHTVRDAPLWATWEDARNVSSIAGFNNSLFNLINSLQTQASLGNSELKYASGNTSIRGTNQTIYGLIQCNPSLSRLDCVRCVKYLVSFFPTHIVMPTFISAEARLVSPSCNLRYDMDSFYGNVAEVGPPPQLPAPPTSNRTPVKRSKSKKTKAIVVVVPIAGATLLVIIIASICISSRKKQIVSTTAINIQEEIDALKSIQYSLGSIKAATEDFSDNNKLGEGGFGIVYKGKLPDGQEIAVKRLAKNPVQGAPQFKNEILILAKLQHINLVRLLGFCLENEEMLLIYEFVVNKSLDKFLFGASQGASMPWEIRYKIINNIAKGLHYLHEDSRLRIIHRDLKAGNILLDEDLNPKIADFGMARLFNIDQTQAAASKIVGTYGYMAPEYVLHGQVSTKSDVFSFGVLVLEIVSGQRISSFQIGHPENMLTFAWKNWLEGAAWSLVDPTLSPAYSTEILRSIHIGLLCVQHNMADRPTMSSVGLMLSSASVSLHVPSQPAFFSHTSPNVPSPENNITDRSSTRSPCSIIEYSTTQVSPR